MPIQPTTLVIDGLGSWTRNSYRSAVLSLDSDSDIKSPVSVWYVDGGDHPVEPDWRSEQWHGRDLLDGSNSWITENYAESGSEKWAGLNADAVFIVTPDYAHMRTAESYAGTVGPSARAASILVEKPFAENPTDAHAFRAAVQSLGDGRPQVQGLDHYALQLWVLEQLCPDGLLEEIGPITLVEFFMLERKPTDSDRLQTLHGGLTRDMGSHLLGLSAPYFDLASMSDVKALCGAKHSGLESFGAETCSLLSFTIERIGSAGSVPCVSVVGKGIGSDVKFLDLHGTEGRFVRLDFTRFEESTDYPFRHAILGSWTHDLESSDIVRDPYRSLIDQNPTSMREKLYRKGGSPYFQVHRHVPVMENPYFDLMKAIVNRTASPSLISHDDCESIVDALELWSGKIQEFPKLFQKLRSDRGCRAFSGWPIHDTFVPPEALTANGPRVYRIPGEGPGDLLVGSRP